CPLFRGGYYICRSNISSPSTKQCPDHGCSSHRDQSAVACSREWHQCRYCGPFDTRSQKSNLYADGRMGQWTVFHQPYSISDDCPFNRTSKAMDS
ncbi:hypothetical protein H0H93_000928, partial [Arthromyces matolae]